MTAPASASRAERVRLLLALYLAAGAGLGIVCASAGAARAESPDGPAYAIDHFSIQYGEDDPKLPNLEGLGLDLELGVVDGDFVEPREGIETRSVELPTQPRDAAERFRASAIGHICSVLVKRFQSRGWVGIYVAPDPRDIDLETERDLRRPEDAVLRLVVSAGRVKSLRSMGLGDRLPETWRIDNKAHRRIREGSPLQPAELDVEGSTDLLRRDLLEDYLFRLNRHPGRRVDAALGPSEDGLGANLDYMVSESRPWFVYAQTSNTGTRETNRWQNRLGFVHRQLTDRDDILSIDYLNAGLDEVNAVNISYSAPWFSPRRPDWLSGSGDPDGLAVEKIPWIGSERLRWRVSGSWSRTKTENVDFTDDVTTNEWDLGGGLVYNIFQHRAFFIDVFGGMQLRSLEADNRTASSQPREYLWQPEIGVEAERVNEYSDLFGSVSVERSLRSLSDDEVDFFGRIGADKDWTLLHFDAGWSHFLEPLLNRSSWQDPSTESSSKLAHEVALSTRGQVSFGSRLIPQFSQVVGGLYSVRGYPQSEVAGDTVAIGSFEYRYHLARSLPISRKPMRVPYFGDFRAAPQQVYGQADWDLVLRAFVDVGRTVRHDRPDGSDERNETLLGVGLGAELQFLGNLRARFDWGHALRDSRGGANTTDAGNDQFYFLFSVLY